MWDYIVLFSIFFLSSAFFAWVWYMKPPFNPCYNQSTGQPYPPLFARPLCSYLTEVYSDGSIPKPEHPVDVVDFQFVSGSLNGGFCQPVHYAYRFVRIADGGFGELSDWSRQLLSCEGNTANGCNRNTPTLGLLQQPPITYSSNEWILNVHRQVGDLDPKSEGTIVGYLSVLPSPSKGVWAMFTDLGAVSPVSPAGLICTPSS